MANTEHSTGIDRNRIYTDIPNAAFLAANAVGALHLAIKGFASIMDCSEPNPAEVEALQWLADFASDAAEATTAFANGLPARWPVFQQQVDAVQALSTIAGLNAG